MGFCDTVNEISLFYEKYDKVVSNVDALFDIIDENAGEIINGEIKKIQNILQDFWNDCAHSNILNETAEDENFSVFLKQLEDKNAGNDKLMQLCKDIQSYFRNYSAVDSKPIVHCESALVIKKLFDRLQFVTDNKSAFTITRILYELVTDDLLIRCGISKLYKWNYGTDAFSMLTTEEQLVIVLNQSIMIDRLHSGHHLLKTYLTRLNKLLSGFEHLDWFVYYVAGFLNFKIHNYHESKEYFENVEKNKNFNSSDLKAKKRYFHSVLLIAYGYEYEGRFSEAIAKIVKPVDQVLESFKSIHLKEFDNCRFILSTLNEMVDTAVDNSLFYIYFQNEHIAITEQISNPKNKDIHNMHAEILHALAHCINEYAIQNYKSNIEGCSKLIRFARALMRFIANINCEYWTCYATIYGEHKDYDIALRELANAGQNICICKSRSKLRESLDAEIHFFQYYFGQMINKDVEKEKIEFSSYCLKYSDDDAYCHLQIFEFRSKLKNYLSVFFDYLSKKNQSREIIQELPATDAIDKAYEEVCKLHPSPYMNINVRAELRIMQRIYIAIIRLKEYILEPSEYNEIKLSNSCKRFCGTKKEFGLPKNSFLLPQGIATDSLLTQEISSAFFGEGGIVHCLNTSDSVFVLAPISGIVVYQYQTGTIDKLFDVDFLLKGFKLSVEKDIKYTHTRSLVSVYWSTVLEDTQFQIANISIDSLVDYGVECISLWSSDAPARLLQLTKDLGAISRRLTNQSLFEDILKKAIRNDDTNLCVKTGYNHCKIHSCKLPWLEFINEEETDDCFLLYKRSNDNNIQYLILSGNLSEDKQYCSLHNLLKDTTIIPIPNQPISNQPVHKKKFDSNNSIDNLNEIKEKILELKNFEKQKKEELNKKKSSRENYRDTCTIKKVDQKIDILKKEIEEVDQKISQLINQLFKSVSHEDAKSFCRLNDINFNSYSVINGEKKTNEK